MSELSHLDPKGRARMVDVGGKEPTSREAIAEVEALVAPLPGELPDKAGLLTMLGMASTCSMRAL